VNIIINRWALHKISANTIFKSILETTINYYVNARGKNLNSFISKLWELNGGQLQCCKFRNLILKSNAVNLTPLDTGKRISLMYTKLASVLSFFITKPTGYNIEERKKEVSQVCFLIFF
jgi:hypothetical protein